MFSARTFDRAEVVNHLLTVADKVLSSPISQAAKKQAITTLVESAASQLNSFFNPRQSFYMDIVNHYMMQWVQKFEMNVLKFTPVEEADAMIANAKLTESFAAAFTVDTNMQLVFRLANAQPSDVLEKFQYALFHYEGQQSTKRCVEAEKYESDIRNAWSGSSFM